MDEIKIGIYKITSPNGKVYIGQSTNIEKRFYTYKKLQFPSQTLLKNSFLMYGVENHIFEIIQICCVEVLDKLEIFYIKFYASNVNGLNQTNGGQKYFYHNDEVKKRMSIAQLGNKKTLGRKQSIEEIHKRTSKTTGLKRSIEQRERISKSLTGRRLSESHRLKGVGRLINNKLVINTETGEIYQSAKILSEIIGVKRSTLIARLNGQNVNNTNFKYL